MNLKRKASSSPIIRTVKSKLGYCMTMTVVDKLDDNLLGEILTRLPAKTLAQLKIVNKRWYSLISDPSFVNKHTSLQTIRDAPSFFTAQTYNGRIARLSFDPSSPSILSKTIISLGLPKELVNRCVVTIQGCHGLLLLVLPSPTRLSTLCIYNPLTKKKQLIPFPDKIRLGWHREFGLAFGPTSSPYYYNHYNVVCLVRTNIAFQFKIFSPEIGRWRDAAKTTMISYGNGLNSESSRVECTPVCFRGIVHWLTKKGDIIAFNAVREETRMIEIPKSVSKMVTSVFWDWWDCVWLGVVEDEVNLVAVSGKHEIVVWVLHDYENKIWKIKRRDVIKKMETKCRFFIQPMFFDGERLVLAVQTAYKQDPWKFHWQEHNIKTGVSGPLCDARNFSCFPCISTLVEVGSWQQPSLIRKLV